MFAAGIVQTTPQVSGSGSTITINPTSTGSGNLIVGHVRLTSGTATITSVTDNRGNAYVVSAALVLGSVTLYQFHGVQGISAVTTITVNLSISVTYRAGVDEYSGLAASNAAVLDQQATNTGSGTAISCPLSPSAAGKMVIATCQSIAIGTWSAGASYTIYFNNAAPTSAVIGMYRLIGTTSETAPATFGSGAWSEIATSFNLLSAPWSYTQNFNSLNTAALNGQDSWAGDVDFLVQTAEKYEGAKAVGATAANGSISRSVTTTDADTVYVAMKRPDTTGSSTFDFMVGALVRFSIVFSGSNITITNGAGTTTLVTGYSTSTFYLFEITYNASNQHIVRYHDGANWSSPTAALAALNNGNINTIRMVQGSAGTAYWDVITDTNPVVINTTMVAAAGSFALTGIAALFHMAISMAAAVGSFALTGYNLFLRFAGWSNRGRVTDTSWNNRSRHP